MQIFKRKLTSISYSLQTLRAMSIPNKLPTQRISLYSRMEEWKFGQRFLNFSSQSMGQQNATEILWGKIQSWFQQGTYRVKDLPMVGNTKDWWDSDRAMMLMLMMKTEKMWVVSFKVDMVCTCLNPVEVLRLSTCTFAVIYYLATYQKKTLSVPTEQKPRVDWANSDIDSSDYWHPVWNWRKLFQRMDATRLFQRNPSKAPHWHSPQI